MGSMHTGLEEHPDGFVKLAAFYAERARGEVGLIVTGGISPNDQGALWVGASKLTDEETALKHRVITEAVHNEGGKICLQILHAGRYAVHPDCVSASAIQAPINLFTPRALTEEEIEQTIDDFARCAELARQGGYTGVEIMGSEGYFINQFIAARTNQREDSWGGSYENRMRLPLEIVRRVRAKVGTDFIVIFRLSMLDLVDGGSTWEEVMMLAKQLELAGVSIINTGIGWHEARIPTIGMMVPRGAFTWVTKKLMGEVKVPLVTTNRINTPELAEEILVSGCADMVSMARPFLADPHFVAKAARNASEEINTCIGCNQACLDKIFVGEPATCLVNPFAARETEWTFGKVDSPRKVIVIGAGPAGLSAALTAAQRGHRVTLYEASQEAGGQLNLARTVPSKGEFNETLRYYRTMLSKFGVQIITGVRVDEAVVASWSGVEEVILSTGVRPRKVDIQGSDLPHVVDYSRILSGEVSPGHSVVLVGAGGIAMDTAKFLIAPHTAPEAFLAEWGVNTALDTPGGIAPAIKTESSNRQLVMLQRRRGKAGSGLGKTTVWAHRKELERHGVQFIDGVEYDRITAEAVHIRRMDQTIEIPADQVVICAGQESEQSLLEVLTNAGYRIQVVGGARLAGELDARRAIEEGALAGMKV